MARPQAYKLLADSALNKDAKAGMTVYAQSGHDYGMASDDTRMTGIPHTSVTLDNKGGYPGFTIPTSALEKLPMPEPSYPDDAHVKDVCKIGQRAACCRYLVMGPRGWSCEKFTAMGRHIDGKVQTMSAQGDNCEGKDSR